MGVFRFTPSARPLCRIRRLERMNATGQALHVDAEALEIDIKSIPEPTRALTGSGRRSRACYGRPTHSRAFRRPCLFLIPR